MPSPFAENLVGRVFGRLTVASRVSASRPKWRCQCECGAVRDVWATHLRSGRTKSCGCYNADKARRHGLTSAHRAEYLAWQSARRRCHEPTNKSYPRYGGRGIIMCEQWRDSPTAFFRDMGPRPSPAHSLDRIDNNGPYSPDNCRWAEPLVQNNNRRVTAHVRIKGREMPLRDACRQFGVSPDLVSGRIKRGWDHERALTEPSQRA